MIVLILGMDDTGTSEAASMDPMTWSQADNEQRAHASRAELVKRLARAVPAYGTAEPLAGLLLRRAAAPMELGHSVSYPSVCVIAQGSKGCSFRSTCGSRKRAG